MTKQATPKRLVRQINLTLPAIQTDSYEIYYTVPQLNHQPSSKKRSNVESKSIGDNKNDNKKANHLTSGMKSSIHSNGRVTVNLLVEMPTIPIESMTSMGDTVSKPLSSLNHTGQSPKQPLSKAFPMAPASSLTTSSIQHSKSQCSKSDESRSQVSSIDKVLYESQDSFGDIRTNRAKNNPLRNTQYPKLNKMKVLHTRKMPKNGSESNSNEASLQTPRSFAVEHLLHQSITLSRQHLHEKIEQLTRTYFPSIQQIRQGHPCGDITKYRAHLHREDIRDYVRVMPRSRLS